MGVEGRESRDGLYSGGGGLKQMLDIYHIGATDEGDPTA
jgi:hypothetical protein